MEPQCRPLRDTLHEIPDPRQARGRRHPLAAILALMCVAMLCGYQETPADATCSAANCVAFGIVSPASNTTFSIQAYLPGESVRQGAAMYFCVGSSGNTSIHNSVTDPTMSSPGCQTNP